MLKSIQSLRGFGIFDEYARPAGMKDFCDRNVIYGWNYSGKTTLSRLFHILNEKATGETFLGSRFTVHDHADVAIDEVNLAHCAKKIRVFNTDFIDASLNWTGKAFNPILLLGAEANDAQKQIDHFEKVIKRCLSSAAAHRNRIALIDQTIADQKTAVAKQIKETVNIVETFTATQLGLLLASIAARPNETYTLTQDQLTADLSLATASETDRLPDLAKPNLVPRATGLNGSLPGHLAKLPTTTQIIEVLRRNPALSEWVATGIRLHGEGTICQFCLNELTADRQAALRAHFSKEYTTHRAVLEATLRTIDGAILTAPDIRESELNPQFRSRFQPLTSQLGNEISAYNTWLADARAKVELKISEPFTAVSPLPDPKPLDDAVTAAVTALNVLIDDNNSLNANFATSKGAAVTRLKHYYAQQFRVDFKLTESDAQKAELDKQAKRFDRARAQATAKVAEQQARINRAQNGREKINERIAELLNSESIHIEVQKDQDVDKFILKRGNHIARNLSEGEKTAIAFAYFLTKLLEDGDLADVIVYIDDPISSLDSNHIFQVYSILRSTFFKFEKPPNAKGKWVTTCKQVFISTHNFEFFQLLHDLPGDTRYFLTKRLTSTRATFTDLPLSVARYTSEYHYLFHILHSYHTSQNKNDEEHLLALPNAARRFIELYTYAKLPLGRKVSVDERLERLFGEERASRIMKVLHHFSHLQSIERLMVNTDLVADIEAAVALLMEHLQGDKAHYEALVEAVTRKN